MTVNWKDILGSVTGVGGKSLWNSETRAKRSNAMECWRGQQIIQKGQEGESKFLKGKKGRGVMIG